MYTVSSVAGASDIQGNNQDSGQAVAGDSDTLPQTDGISPLTLIGFLGLVLVATGGTIFTIFRK